MSRVLGQQRHKTIGGHAVKIGGKMVNVHFARIAYRCAECLGTLEIAGAGLRCKTDHGHRRFITKMESEAIKLNQEKNVETLKETYQITNGKVVLK